jgi:replication factor A1
MSVNIDSDDILDAISDEYAEEIAEAEVEAQIESFKQFGIDSDSIESAVITKLAGQLDVDSETLTGGGAGGGSNGAADLREVEEIDSPDEWVSMEVEVVDIWDSSDTDSIAQAGLLSDGTGRIKFTSWDKSNLMLLNHGEQYRLENVITDEFNGRMSVNLNSSTDISFLDGEKNLSDDVEVSGAAVALQAGSGLIKRCAEDDCSRTLGMNGDCEDHGEVDSELDIRLKLVLDDGTETVTTVLNDHDTIAEMTGIGFEEARQMAQDALDHEVVADEMEDRVLGRYYTVTGVQLGDIVAANDIEQHHETTDITDLLIKARSL